MVNPHYLYTILRYRYLGRIDRTVSEGRGLDNKLGYKNQPANMAQLYALRAVKSRYLGANGMQRHTVAVCATFTPLQFSPFQPYSSSLLKCFDIYRTAQYSIQLLEITV